MPSFIAFKKAGILGHARGLAGRSARRAGSRGTARGLQPRPRFVPRFARLRPPRSSFCTISKGAMPRSGVRANSTRSSSGSNTTSTTSCRSCRFSRPRRDELEAGRVSIVQSDAYLGSMTAEEIVALLYPRRRDRHEGALRAGARALDRLHVATTRGSARLLGRTISRAFRHMRPALRRLCEEFPWTTDGLSRSQRQALQAVGHGAAARNDELFRRAQAREESPFLGDSAFYALLEDLTPNPRR